MNFFMKLKTFLKKDNESNFVDVCIVSSCGGHLTEVDKFYPSFSKYKHIYILNDKIKITKAQAKLYHFVSHSERDWKFFLNLYEFFVLFVKFRPKIIISTGAGPIVPASIIGKFFFHTQVIYIETITRIHDLSLTGKLMYYIADDFFCQWPFLLSKYKKAKLIGPVL